jgi:hypothetical protein
LAGVDCWCDGPDHVNRIAISVESFEAIAKTPRVARTSSGTTAMRKAPFVAVILVGEAFLAPEIVIDPDDHVARFPCAGDRQGGD